MKESRLLEMRNKVETLGNIVQNMINELENLKNLSVGTLETLKRMDGYEQAISKLTDDYGKEKDTTGAPTGDSELLGTDE